MSRLDRSIWNHLVRLSTDYKHTVIITTHYIEEARQAHAVSDCVPLGGLVECARGKEFQTLAQRRENNTRGNDCDRTPD